MKTHNLIKFVGIVLASAFFTTPAFAINDKVNFPAGQTAGEFSCTFDGWGNVNITTDNVEVKGFCVGDPGVSKNGAISVITSDIKDYYFQIKKNATQSGSVTISSDSKSLKDIHCSANKGGKEPYPHGDKYC